VWVKTLKAQNPRGTEFPKTHVLVMEFKDEQALKDYAGRDTQKKWYEVYTPIRQQSVSHDVTNRAATASLAPGRPTGRPFLRPHLI